jgi:hypothetical protein
MVDTGDACAHFVSKWQQREPGMRIAEVFCPAADKPVFRAWGALLHELRETLFELSDARVTGVKTGWWAEELIGVGQGRQRHPLTAALLERPNASAAPWSALARALLDFDADAPRAADTEQALAALLPTANAIIAVEASLFSTDASSDAARSLAVHWLLHRLPRGLAHEDQARIPMHLLARHGLTAAELGAGAAQGKRAPKSANSSQASKLDALLRDWGRELAAAMPAQVGGAALLRRGQHRFDQARAQRLAAGKGLSEPPPLHSLWRAWRAARSR